ERGAPRRVPARIRRVLRRGLLENPRDRYPTLEALLRALRRARDAPRRRSLVAATLFAAAVLGLAATGRAEKDVRCSGAEERLAGVWDPARRSALEAAFRGTGRSWAGDVSRTTNEALDGYRQGWILQHTEVCRATQVRGEQSPALMDRRMDCLDQRRSELRALVDFLESDPEGALDRAVELASTLSPLADCADTPALMAPLQAPAEGEARQKVRSLRRRLAQARIQEEAGRYDEARSEAASVLEESQSLGYWPLTAEAWARLGSAQGRLGEREEAAASLRQALLAAQAGRHDRAAAEAAIALVRLSANEEADLAQGELYSEVAAALLGPLRQAGVLEASLADARGLLFFQGGDYEAAEKEHRRALAQLREVLGPGHPALASSLVRLSNVTAENGDLAAAKSLLQEALEIHVSTLGENHPLTGTTHDRLGSVAFREGDLLLARGEYQRALEIKRATLGPRHRKVGITLMHLGNVESREGHYDRAVELFRQALEILESALGPDHPHTAIALGNLGAALADQGKGEEALEYHRRALEIQERTLGVEHPWAANHHFNLGKVANDLGRFAEARRHLEAALEIWRKAYGEVHPSIAQGTSELGRSLLGLGLARDARTRLEHSLELQESTPSDPLLLAETRFYLARSLEASSGESRRALELATAAGRALEEVPAGGGRLHDEIEAWLRHRQVSSASDT
ncbi:MAG: tetratricopeptide repeat protein, partial [Acidobacteria bacterium]|nr:tetratricopeptide repeat protein [Acidobacteriota bacterium]